MEMIRQMYIKDSVDADFIIIQMFKAKIYEHIVSIGETFYVSNILFSQECADILECKKRFSSNSLLKRSKTIISASTVSSFEDDQQLGVNNITTIHALYTNCQDFDPLFPEELLGREMMAKENVKNTSLFNENSDDANENKHTIIKICTDENIISKYACNMNPSQADSTCDDVKTPHKVDCGFVVTVEIDDDSSVKRVLFDGDGLTSVSSKMQKKITVKIENN